MYAAMSADLTPAPPPALPARLTMDRRQTRELLEQWIGLDVVLEALEFAITAEPDPSGDPHADPSAVGMAVPAPSNFRQLYDLMTDPAFTPFAIDGSRPRAAIDTLMTRAKVKLPEILTLIGQRNLGMAIARSGRRLDKVIDGIGEAAEPREERCGSCDPRTADAPADPDCPECRGTGKVRRMGNLEAAKLFVNIHGGSTGSAKAAGAGGTGTTINLAANAIVRAGDKQNGPETVTARIQKLIE
jgi:hypothetical protein